MFGYGMCDSDKMIILAMMCNNIVDNDIIMVVYV